DGICTGTYTGDMGAITAPAAGTTVTGVLDRPGTVYKDAAGLTLTCTEAAGVYSWSLITDADYPNASVLSSSVINSGTGLGTIDISLDGTGTKDLQLTLAGASPANGNTIVVALANNATFSLSDVPVDFSAVTLNNGATIGAANVINWNLQGEGASTITQYASSSVVRSLTSDGYSSGSLKSLSIDSEGIISGFFTNGQTTELAQIMLAKFTNPWGLQKMGDNLFAETITSGAAIQNYAGQGGIGSLTSNSLEMSNTDIATEFIKMITAQKAYQANAKVVTTESDMMQVLMNIKQ
ncbi:MAG: flagellar hook-basal body complex protein, partial [Smithellaceae bacterium]